MSTAKSFSTETRGRRNGSESIYRSNLTPIPKRNYEQAHEAFKIIQKGLDQFLDAMNQVDINKKQFEKYMKPMVNAYNDTKYYVTERAYHDHGPEFEHKIRQDLKGYFYFGYFDKRGLPTYEDGRPVRIRKGLVVMERYRDEDEETLELYDRMSEDADLAYEEFEKHQEEHNEESI
jgi:hypothetical protein